MTDTPSFLPHPIRFVPQLKTRVWGGDRLTSVLKKGPHTRGIGESWEISGLPEHESIVAEGPWKGRSINTLLKQFPDAILGKKVVEHYGKSFPLLIKFIDAKIPLSVQVHPDDTLAKKRYNTLGKSEMWYVLEADDTAELSVGFKKHMTPDQYLEAVQKNTLTQELNRLNVRANDAIYIPAGTIHAIGGGILLAEVQQASDVTYRIYDYDRLDPFLGKKRDLHTSEAIEALHFSKQTPSVIHPSLEQNTVTEIVKSPYFHSQLIQVNSHFNRDLTLLDSFCVYLCTQGSIDLVYDKKVYGLERGQCLLVPAQNTGINFQGMGMVLEISIGD